MNNILAAKGYTVDNTDGRMDTDGNSSLTYKYNNPKFDSTTYAVSANGTEIKNQLSDADINLYGGTEDEITYVSRNDWEGTLPQSILKMKLTEQMIEDLQDVQYDPDD